MLLPLRRGGRSLASPTRPRRRPNRRRGARRASWSWTTRTAPARGWRRRSACSGTEVTPAGQRRGGARDRRARGVRPAPVRHQAPRHPGRRPGADPDGAAPGAARDPDVGLHRGRRGARRGEQRAGALPAEAVHAWTRSPPRSPPPSHRNSPQRRGCPCRRSRARGNPGCCRCGCTPWIPACAGMTDPTQVTVRGRRSRGCRPWGGRPRPPCLPFALFRFPLACRGNAQTSTIQP